MTIEEALYSKVSGTSGVTDLIGLRFYPAYAAQAATLPYAIFELIPSGGPVHVLGGLPTLQRDRVQVSVFAGTYASANQITRGLKAALRGFTGVMGGSGGVYVSACLDDATRTDFEGDPIVHRHITDFMISHDAV